MGGSTANSAWNLAILQFQPTDSNLNGFLSWFNIDFVNLPVMLSLFVLWEFAKVVRNPVGNRTFGMGDWVLHLSSVQNPILYVSETM